MNIALGSIFRTAERHLPRFVAQVESLACQAPQHTFEPILIEGDSTDHTWEILNDAFPGRVFKREHGGPPFPSVDVPLRWVQISFACNGVLEQLKPEHDVLLYVECDLMWEPTTMLKLLSWLDRYPAVVPMCMLGEMFYDVWGFRVAGANFTNQRPYHPVLAKAPPGALIPLEYGGSCMAIIGAAARACRFTPPVEAMRGFCHDLKKHEYGVWLDPTVAVYHPRV